MTYVYTACSVCVTTVSTKSTHFQILWSYTFTKFLLEPLLMKPKPILPDIQSPLGPVLQSCSNEAHITIFSKCSQMCCTDNTMVLSVQ